MTSDLTQDRGRSTAKTCTRQRLANRVRVAAMFAAICNASVTNKPHNSISTEYKPKWICFNAANLWKSIPHSAFAYLALSLPDNFSRVTNGISAITINFWMLRQEIFLPKTINKKEGNTMYNHLFSHRKSMQQKCPVPQEADIWSRKENGCGLFSQALNLQCWLGDRRVFSL